MDRFANISNKQLETLVSERKKLMIEIVKFIEEVTIAIGKIVSERTEDDHIHIVRKLVDFGGFNFKSSTGQTVIGGNTFEIFDAITQALLLEVYYQINPDECKVDHFYLTGEWLTKLQKVMRDKQRIMEERINEKAKQKKLANASEEEFQKRKRLLEVAERLKL